MSRILVVCAAFALVLMLALPGPANAAERRADGLRTKDMTESVHSGGVRGGPASRRGCASGRWRRACLAARG